MKKGIRNIFLSGFLVFILIQLYQPARNLSYEQVFPLDLTNVYPVPEKVAIVLKTSCYDCHSNNTNYPWYAYLQPARYFMESHIKEGKENLNFNTFGSYSKRKQKSKLARISKQIKSEEMPLKSYTWIHSDAVINDTQKQEVIDWIDHVLEE